MTTIAYKDGVLAGDRRIMAGDTHYGSRIKVCRRDDGALFGASGESAKCLALKGWFLGGENEPFPADIIGNGAECMIVRPDRTVEWRRGSEHKAWPNASEFAIGSGALAARGAMIAGADAPAAVMAAIALDSWTGDGVDVLTLAQTTQAATYTPVPGPPAPQPRALRAVYTDRVPVKTQIAAYCFLAAFFMAFAVVFSVGSRNWPETAFALLNAAVAGACLFGAYICRLAGPRS